MKLPTDERIRRFRRRQRPATGGALLPVRPLSAHQLLASGRPAGNLAGPVEREHEPALAKQIHHQHQHRDELLARRVRQPRRVRRAADRDGERPHRDRRPHRAERCMARAAGWCITTPISGAPSAPIDGPNWGMWPSGGAWLCLHLWDRYEFSGDQADLRAHLPGAEGRVGVLPRHVAGGAEAPMARHQSLHLAGERPSVRRGGLRRADDGHANPARPVRQHDPGGGDARRGRGSPPATRRRARPAGAEPDRQRGAVAGMARGLGHEGAGDCIIATSRISTACIRAATSIVATRRNWRRR